MTKYKLDPIPHNLKAHKIIEDEMMNKKNGVFTCTIRVHDSHIVDVVILETHDQSKTR